MDRLKLFGVLIETIREFQLQNRFAVRAQGTALDLLSSRLLTDIDSDPNILASELSARLSLSPTVISRTLAKLEHAGFIQSFTADSDARARRIELTPAGIRVLEDFDRQSDTRLSDFQANISKKDFLVLTRLLFQFAEGFGKPMIKRKKNEHSLRPAIRNITHSLGLLHGGIFGTRDLGSAEWQALSLIAQAPCPIAARDLAAQLTTPKNTVSQLIGRLEKSKLLNRVQAEHDMRVVSLTLTNQGEAELQYVREAGITLLKGALADFTVTELKDLVRLLSIFVGGSHAIIAECKRLVIVRATTPDTLAALRSFSVSQASMQNRTPHIQASFYSDLCRAYALYDHNTLVAGLEFQAGNDSENATVQHWFHAPDYDSPDLKADFLRKTATLLFADSTYRRIAILAEQKPSTLPLAGRYVHKLAAHIIQPEDL